MAGPRITRLGDPANPYTQKKTPTAAPTPAQQTANRAASRRVVAPAAPVAPPKPKPKASGLLQRVNEQHGGGARKRVLDAAIAGKPKPKR